MEPELLFSFDIDSDTTQNDDQNITQNVNQNIFEQFLTPSPIRRIINYLNLIKYILQQGNMTVASLTRVLDIEYTDDIFDNDHIRADQLILFNNQSNGAILKSDEIQKILIGLDIQSLVINCLSLVFKFLVVKLQTYKRPCDAREILWYLTQIEDFVKTFYNYMQFTVDESLNNMILEFLRPLLHMLGTIDDSVFKGQGCPYPVLIEILSIFKRNTYIRKYLTKQLLKKLEIFSKNIAKCDNKLIDYKNFESLLLHLALLKVFLECSLKGFSYINQNSPSKNERRLSVLKAIQTVLSDNGPFYVLHELQECINMCI